jgi:4-amino-4-deoxy-L-arabinose transferase-like glycosyltransferase
VNNWLWRSGIGASVPSMLAYIAGVLGIYRLVKGFASRAAAWIASLTYALNPNLLYMQSTAMTEALYLALFIWSVVFFSEFVRQAKTDSQQARKSLERCAMVISAAMLVRYDAWFLAACAAVALILTMWRFRLRSPEIYRGAAHFVLLIGLTACLWLAYNHAAYYNALEFANGPYSARAIAARSRSSAMPAYPGENSLRTAALYFLKAVRLDVGEGKFDLLLLGIAFTALLSVFYFSRRHLPLTLLWLPIIFYVLSISWGSVPIFCPQWWPFSYYNVRYGLEMLPAIAAFVALAYAFLARFVPVSLASGVVLLSLAVSYLSVWHNRPICVREAEVNGAARMALDARLAIELQKLPSSATVMMYCGSHSGAVQAAGIPLRRVLREGNHPDWEIGLSAPSRAADYVVAIEGDEVFLSVRLFPQELRLLATVEAPGQPRVFLYRSLHRA